MDNKCHDRFANNNIMTKQKINWKIVCTGLVCLTGLEIYALSKGINGVVLSTVIAIIALAIGITLPSPIK